MRSFKRKLAIIDIYETAEFLAQNDLEVAVRVINAVEASIKRIEEIPKIGKLQKFSNEKDLRMWNVRGFPKVLIFYLQTQESIEIVRVIHSARDFYRILDLQD